MFRVGLASIVIFVLWSASDFLVHGLMLDSSYAEAGPGLFRPADQMKMPLLQLVVLVHAAVFVKIYDWLVSPKSILAGVVFGVLWGVGHGVGMGYGTYATMPIAPNLAASWCLLTIVQGILAGVAVSLIVRSRTELPV